MRAYKPNLRDYIGQCELNYVRMEKLLPYLGERDERVFGVDQGTAELGRVRCCVIERAKFTTTVEFVQESELSDWLPKPTIKVRLYHDARMAEVLAFQKNRYIKPKYEYPNKNMYQRDEKAQNNRFLGEWLQHCLQHGRELMTPFVDSLGSRNESIN